MKNIDRLVYIFYKSNEKCCKEDFISFIKFRPLLETSFKKEIQLQIINDLTNSSISISDSDIYLVANNIYVQSCLEANNIDINIITEQIMLRNRAYNNFQKEESKHVDFNVEAKFCKQLVDKYIKLIKELIK